MDDKPTATPGAATGNPIQDNLIATAPSAPTLPRGPNASPIIVGLLALLVAGLIIANQTVALRIDWSRVGPASIFGSGIAMVMIGAIGLVRRHDRA